MARKKNAETEQEDKSGEQLDLIDFHPENSDDIIAAAKQYKKYQKQRIGALDKEKEYKKELLSLVKNAGLTPLPDGSIKFRIDGFVISITPRDELVKTKDGDEE